MLAKECGRLDVDQMLSEIQPEDMDGWEAMNEISPIGDEKIARVLALGFAAMVQRLDVILKRWCDIKDLPKVKPDSFIPWTKKKKLKPKYVSPNAAAAAFLMAVNK